MGNIKSYDEFNEEVNLKKTLAGAALSAGLAMGSPAVGQVSTTSIELNQNKSVRAINSVSNINSNQVSQIKDYETMASIKVPKDFDTKNAKIYASFLWNSNLPSAPFGGMIFIHSPKLSFFIDVKSNWQFNNDPIEVDDWKETSSFNDDEGHYTWLTSYGSYTKVYHDKTISEGGVVHKKIFDIGISKSIGHNKNLDLKAYIGCGLSKTRTEMFRMTQDFYWKTTYFATEFGADHTGGYYDDGDLVSSYDKIGTKYENKLNVTGGLLFDFNCGLQMGVGFDTKPAGVNLMLGFTIGKQKYLKNKLEQIKK